MRKLLGFLLLAALLLGGCAAGNTGTRTCTASEKSEATKEACRRRVDSSLRSE